MLLLEKKHVQAVIYVRSATFEWMSSPIIYRKHPAFDVLMRNAQEYFLSKPGLYHYLHMAEGNYREYLTLGSAPQPIGLVRSQAK